MKVGYFSFITQWFPSNSEFKISASHCWAISFEYCFFYDDESLLFKQTYLKRRSTFWSYNLTTSSFLIFRYLGIFWIIKGSSMLPWP